MIRLMNRRFHGSSSSGTTGGFLEPTARSGRGVVDFADILSIPAVVRPTPPASR